MSFEEEFPSIVKAERVINCDYPSDDFVYCNELSIYCLDKQRVNRAIEGWKKIHYDNDDKVRVLSALQKELGL